MGSASRRLAPTLGVIIRTSGEHTQHSTLATRVTGLHVFITLFLHFSALSGCSRDPQFSVGTRRIQADSGRGSNQYKFLCFQKIKTALHFNSVMLQLIAVSPLWFTCHCPHCSAPLSLGKLRFLRSWWVACLSFQSQGFYPAWDEWMENVTMIMLATSCVQLLWPFVRSQKGWVRIWIQVSKIMKFRHQLFWTPNHF